MLMSEVAPAIDSNAYELVVGLEVHCQLKTSTKLFCGCETSFGESPNRNTCPVCLALPGALPVLNAHAVELAVRASLSLGCTVHETSVFARKNYFYPDLPKGYQISQFDRPLATGGSVDTGLQKDGTPVRITLTRVHMEEDAGKSVHDRFQGVTAIDLNRAGTPLIEIVSEPDIRSASEAGGYLRTLKQTLQYIDVSDANMEEGSLRVDVNISVRRAGETALGIKTEIKNLNSFSNVERAIEVEYTRQCALLGAGGSVEQQTLLWDDVGNTVRPARSKEGSHDYRYFPEPDLPPLVLAPSWIGEQRARLPELPSAKRARFSSEYGLSAVEIDQLVVTSELAAYFEGVAAASGDPKRSANWVLGTVLASLNATGGSIEQHPVSPSRLGALVKLEANGELSNSAAKSLFALLEVESGEPLEIARREGLMKVSDDAALESWVDQVLAANPAEAARFKAGEVKLLGVLVGQVMKLSKGAADPRKVNQILTARTAG
jgi:aspartyl-tRNA(Asn)/glutamyl-tRNA(Gln) amidotransferase subunit B